MVSTVHEKHNIVPTIIENFKRVGSEKAKI